jgi:hypothetical protein
MSHTTVTRSTTKRRVLASSLLAVVVSASSALPAAASSRHVAGDYAPHEPIPSRDWSEVNKENCDHAKWLKPQIAAIKAGATSSKRTLSSLKRQRDTTTRAHKTAVRAHKAAVRSKNALRIKQTGDQERSARRVRDFRRAEFARLQPQLQANIDHYNKINAAQKAMLRACARKGLG